LRPYLKFLDTGGTLHNLYLERAIYSLGALRMLLTDIASISIEGIGPVKVHIHDEEGTVHVHGEVRIRVEVENVVLLPFVVAGVVSAIDTDIPHTSTEHLKSNVERIAHIIRSVEKQAKSTRYEGGVQRVQADET